MDNLSETSLHGSLAELEEETGQVSTQELEDYLQIITKPAEIRTKKEIEKLIAKLIDMDIFDKALLENLDVKPVVTKLIPFLKYEQFPAGAPIFHYEQPADKLYIIIRGKAREFVPKNLDTIEKESRLHYRSDPIPKDVSLAIADMPTPTSLTAMTSLPETPFGSLETIYEQTTGEKVSTPSGAAKKFRKMKALFPFLKKMIAQKTATQRISDYSYKQSLRKPRKVHYNQDPNEIHLENMGTNIDGDILEEFKRFPKTYFIGGVLKVQFSKYLFAGDYCGQRALKDNALRTLAVIAEEECHCISLHKDDFLEVLGHERSVNADKIDFFKKLFDKYDEKIITKFSLLWEHQTLKMGDIVFQENEPSEYVYALFKGEIIISKTPQNAKKTRNSLTQDLPFRIKKRHDQNDQAIRVATLCPKDFFGDADFFQGSPREFTASVSSIRAKIFRLPLDKFKSAYRRYHDIFTQIKTMTSLKLQWNKERFGDINNSQSSTQIYPQSLGTILEKEKALVQVGQLLSPFNNPRSPMQNHSNKLKESFEPYRTDVLKQTFSQQNVSLVDPKIKMQVTSSVWGGEKSKFSSPKSSTFFGGDYSHKADTKLVESAKRENVDAKTKHHSSLEIEDSNDMQLFKRMRPPREYSSKQEEILKKHKEGPIETSIHFFTPKKTASNKKLLDSSKTKNSTRGSSIQVLKRKVFDTRLEEYGVYPGTSQKGNSIEFDKPQSLVFSQSTMGTIPSLNSINDKVQKPSMCSIVSPSSRRPKPLSMDKINLMSSCENGKGSDTKKVPVNFHVSKLLDHPKKNENGAYYLAPGMRFSVKSRCNDMSKNTSAIQMLSPKADSNDENNFSSFRVIGIVPAKGNHDTMRSSVGNMKNSHIYSQ